MGSDHYIICCFSLAEHLSDPSTSHSAMWGPYLEATSQTWGVKWKKKKKRRNVQLTCFENTEQKVCSFVTAGFYSFMRTYLLQP